MSESCKNLQDAFHFRFACKNFDPERKIPDADFQCILEAARLAPSSFGFEPWKFLVIQNPAVREAMRPICWGAQTQLPSASHFVVVLARQPDAVAPHSRYIQQTILQDTMHLPPEVRVGFTKNFDKFLRDDFQLTGNDRACFEWAARQAYIALAHMLITAAYMGIDSGAMEGFNKENLEKLLAEKGLLDRETYGVACLAAFGYRLEPPKYPKTRRPMEDVAQWVM